MSWSIPLILMRKRTVILFSAVRPILLLKTASRYWLSVIGNLLLVIGYWLLVIIPVIIEDALVLNLINLGSHNPKR
ncbi:hypothetical protein A1QQ_10190 [Vibrio ordalii FF-167]|nr:hypothetical protein A1QQ_10190 [Vibrio ordalii FF-167]